MSWLKSLAENKDERSLAHRMRRKRFAWLEQRLSTLPKPTTVLDVGGTQTFWERMGRAGDPQLALTILNIEAEKPRLANARTVAGDARDLSRFGDASFDLVFSNSVIEHVGSFRDQRAMASEIRRVGRRYFVQTPNRHFPLEPHALVPFFQYLPARLRARVLARRRVGWLPRAENALDALVEAESLRLLSRREVRLLFPDAELIEERFAGLVKSFVAAGGW